MSREEVLDRINTHVRAEKGNRLTEEQLLSDAGLDSFGLVMVFMAIDGEFGYFDNCGYGSDPLKEIPYSTLTVKEMIDRCMSKITSI